MRRLAIVLLAFCCVAVLVACTQDPPATNSESRYTIDYYDAETFEKALNEGEKVNGKIVRFLVNDYKPDSVLGIDIWGGEHLNFIVEEEIDIKAGDIVTGRITKEASQIILLGSWKISFEVLEIEKGPEETIPNETDNTSKPTITEPTEPISTETKPWKITVTMSEEDFKGMNYKEAEKMFREMGFTNFKYRTVDTETASKADTICYIEITEWFFGDTNFVKGDKFYADSTVTFFSYKYEEPTEPPPVHYSTNDYETAKKGNTGVYAYKSAGGNYDIYWIIDFDEGYVYWFTDGNGDGTCDKVKIESGTLNSVVIITYHEGKNTWSYGLHFKYKNQPDRLIVEDQNGFTYEFSTTSLKDALKLRETKKLINF